MFSQIAPEASQHDLSNFLRSTNEEETRDCDRKVRLCGLATGVSHYGTHTFQLQSDNFFDGEMKLNCEPRVVATNLMHQKPPLTNGPLAITASKEAKGITSRTSKSTSEKRTSLQHPRLWRYVPRSGTPLGLTLTWEQCIPPTKLLGYLQGKSHAHLLLAWLNTGLSLNWDLVLSLWLCNNTS